MKKKSFQEFLNVAFPMKNPFIRNEFGTGTNTIKYIAVRISFILYRLGIKANQISLFSAILSIPSFILIYKGTIEEANVLIFLAGYLLMGSILFIDFVDGPLSKMNDYSYTVGDEIDNLPPDLAIMGSFLIFGMMSNNIVFTALFWANAVFLFTYLRYTLEYIPENKKWLLKLICSRFSLLSVRVFVVTIFPILCLLYIYNQELASNLINPLILFYCISSAIWVKATLESKTKRN